MSIESTPTLPEAVREQIEHECDRVLLLLRASLHVRVGDRAREEMRTFGARIWEAAAQQERVRLCTWTSQDDPDYDEVWETQCGHSFQFNDGGPAENHFGWCGYCGGKLVTFRTPPTPEDKVSK